MTISKVWKIEGFYVRPIFDEMENVVSEIQWSLTVQQTDNSDSIIGRTMCNGYVALGEPTSDNFISSENLTKEQLLTWVKSSLGDKVKEYETITFNQTVNQSSNTFVRMGFNESGNVVTQS